MGGIYQEWGRLQGKVLRIGLKIDESMRTECPVARAAPSSISKARRRSGCTSAEPYPPAGSIDSRGPDWERESVPEMVKG